MAHIRLSHSAIIKSPGLLPMLYTVSEMAAALGVPERTLRDWLEAGAPHDREKNARIWYTADLGNNQAFTVTAGVDAAGPTQVLKRTVDAQVFLIIRFALSP